MIRTFDSQRLLGLGLSVLLTTACGSDGKPSKPGLASITPPAHAGDGDSGANASADSGAQVTPPSPNPSGEFGDGDASTTGSDSDAATPGDGGGDHNGDAGTGPSASDGGQKPLKTPGTLLNLPTGGNELSTCYGPDGCNGDDLLCFANDGTAPGFCTDDCKKDTDCHAIDGINAVCLDGYCQVECGGTDNKGDGACPKNMVCHDLYVKGIPGIITPVVVNALFPNWRCIYPQDAGSNTVKVNDKCDLAHGNGDCAGDTLCHVPTPPLTPTPTSGPGYCSDKCQAQGDCQVGGSTSVPLCTNGACEFDCSGAGATCPSGMNCRPVGSGLTQAWRCLYI